jgi:hypothetical protein
MMQNRPASANEIDVCRFLIGISRRFKNTISAVAPLLRPSGRQEREWRPAMRRPRRAAA